LLDSFGLPSQRFSARPVADNIFVDRVIQRRNRPGGAGHPTTMAMSRAWARFVLDQGAADWHD